MQQFIDPSSPIISGCMSLITSFGLQYVSNELQQFTSKIFKFALARRLALFFLLFSTTKSMKVSLILTFIVSAINYAYHFDSISNTHPNTKTKKDQSTQT